MYLTTIQSWLHNVPENNAAPTNGVQNNAALEEVGIHVVVLLGASLFSDSNNPKGN